MQRKAVALRAVKTASSFLKKQYGKVRTGSEKSDGSLVSAADRGSDDMLVKILGKAFPEDGILSEERKEKPSKNGYRWILDPLDGTHNFLAGIPLFCILLALEKDGDTILSFCEFPVLGETFSAEKGKGAFRNGKRIHVSAAKTLDGSIFLVDGNTQSVFKMIRKSLHSFLKKDRFRFLGHAAFGSTRIAMGSALATVVREGKVWDFAATTLLVEEAGGKVTDLNGKRWNKETQSLLMTNGHVHHQALRMLSV